MKVFNNTMTIEDFDAWAGAIYTKKVIIDNDKEADFEYLIEELYPDGIEKTQLNDILWHDSEWVYQQLNITEDE